MPKNKQKYIFTALLVGMLMTISAPVFAVTKPAPGTDTDTLSYVFYLYYDNGQLFADRDYDTKYDLVNSHFAGENPAEQAAFRGEIWNIKSELSQTFMFDPQKGDASFKQGKIMVYGPYVADGLRADFYDNNGQKLITIFVNTTSICDDNGSCNSAAGEDQKTCPNDCKSPTSTPPPPPVIEPAGFFGEFDLNTMLIYIVSGLVVIAASIFGLRWWKKRREESFLPPSTPEPPASPPPPPPPLK